MVQVMVNDEAQFFFRQKAAITAIKVVRDEGMNGTFHVMKDIHDRLICAARRINRIYLWVFLKRPSHQSTGSLRQPHTFGDRINAQIGVQMK